MTRPSHPWFNRHNNTNYEASCCVIFSTLPLLSLSYVKILSSELRSHKFSQLTISGKRNFLDCSKPGTEKILSSLHTEQGKTYKRQGCGMSGWNIGPGYQLPGVFSDFPQYLQANYVIIS